MPQSFLFNLNGININYNLGLHGTFLTTNWCLYLCPVPRVQAVVYTTRSRYQAENEQVVNQVLEATNGPQNGRRAPFKVRTLPCTDSVCLFLVNLYTSLSILFFIYLYLSNTTVFSTNIPPLSDNDGTSIIDIHQLEDTL